MIDLTGDPRVEPFRRGTGERGCLLLHGFTGSPAEMRPLGDHLAGRGWKVSGPVLPGHGTVVTDLASTGWPDWFATALEAWEELGRETRVRVVAGLSVGALLALHLAATRPDEVAALVALAPALRLKRQRTANHARWIARIPALPRRFAFIPKRFPSRETPAYDQVPVRALASLVDLQDVVRKELPLVTAPCLILAGAHDETIHPQSPAEVEAGVASEMLRSARYPASGHILTEDADAPRVHADVTGFLEEALDSPARA